MAHPIQMPKFGQATEEGTIVRWLKKEGDTVAKGDILFETETDKSVMEVESFVDGTLLKILVGAGGTVPVNSTVGFVGTPGEALPDVSAPAAAPAKPADAPKPQVPRTPERPKPPGATAGSKGHGLP